MMTAPQTWSGQASEAVGKLAARPWSLFLVLLLLNAIARPYAGMAHDARLYSCQVLNQLQPAAYADDLFFRYGSQDQFSLFSRIAAPLAGLFGIELTFFLLYLIFNSLFFLALQRFTLRLVDNRAIATLALFYMAVAPLPFGGLGIFNVHEPFLTPRIMANALVLFGLDQLLQQRFARAFLLMLLAGVMHPLMAQGGLLVQLGCLAAAYLGRRRLIGLAAALTVLGAAVLAIPGAGLAIFGPMDDEWRRMVRLASTFNFPDEWRMRDLANLVFSFVAVVVAAVRWPRADAGRANFLWVLALTGFVGFLGTLLASYLPYALFFQVQPYRVLWLLKVVQVPLLFLLATELLQGQDRLGHVFALAALTFLGLTNALALELCFPLFFLPVLVLGYRGLEAQPRTRDWLVRSGLGSLLIGFCGWTAYKSFLVVQARAELLARADALDFLRLLLENVGAVVWVLVTLVGLIRLARGGFRPTFAACVLACGLVLQAAWFIIPTLPAYRDHLTRYGQDVQFVRDYLKARRPANDPLPTVYSFMGRVDYLWVDVRAKSYFDCSQIVGALFNRKTAMEAQRRAQVAGPFEIERVLEEAPFWSQRALRVFQDLFGANLDSPPPGVKDLERLCRDELVDFVVIKQAFPSLVAATNGRINVYDCRQVRAALNLPSPTSVTTVSKTGKEVASVTETPRGIFSPSNEEISP